MPFAKDNNTVYNKTTKSKFQSKSQLNSYDENYESSSNKANDVFNLVLLGLEDTIYN